MKILNFFTIFAKKLIVYVQSGSKYASLHLTNELHTFFEATLFHGLALKLVKDTLIQIQKSSYMFVFI